MEERDIKLQHAAQNALVTLVLIPTFGLLN